MGQVGPQDLAARVLIQARKHVQRVEDWLVRRRPDKEGTSSAGHDTYLIDRVLSLRLWS